MFALVRFGKMARSGNRRARGRPTSGLATCRWLLIFALLLPLALGACDGAEEREAAHFERGKALFDDGNLVKARIEFKNARQINPLNVEALYYLGLIAEKEKNYKAAFGAFRQVVEQEPKHLEGNIRFGRYLLLVGKTDDALARAEAALGVDPDNAEAHALRGAVLLQRGNVPEARTEALAARAADPGNEAALTLLVGVLRKEGKTEEAIDILKKSIATNPKSTTAWRVLVEIYRLRKDIVSARAAYEEIIRLEPTVRDHRLELARLLLGGGRKDQAEDVLRQGVAAAPDDRARKEMLVGFLISQSSLEVAEKEIKEFVAADPESNAFRFALARLYTKHRKFDSAESVLQEIETGKSQPDALKAKTALARLRLLAGDAVSAREIVKSVLAIDPANGDALTTQARLLLGDGNDDAAIANLRTVLRDNPNSAEAHRLLAEAHLRAGSLELAADSLRKSLVIDPDDEPARLRLVRVYTRRKNYDQALDLVEQSLLRTPRSIPLQARKVELLIAKGDVGRALDAASKMQADSAEKNSPLAQYALGRAYQAAGRHDKAVKSFERVLGSKPRSRNALRALVGSKLAQKRAAEATAYLESIREDAPKNIFALNMLGELYALQKAYDKAEKAFTQAMEAKRDWRVPYINLAKIMLMQEQEARAVEVLKRGMVQLPDDAMLRFSLATAYHADGNYDAALAEFETVLARHPDNAMAANNVAAIIADHKYTNAESLDRAMRIAQAQRDSKNPYFLDTLGWLYYRKGDFSLAVLYLKQAVEGRPDNANMNYHLAMAYYDGGNRQAARPYLEKAVATDAPYPELEKARALLKSMM